MAKADSWIQSMRAVLRGVGRGWTARDMRGRVQISIRYADGQRTTVVTEIPWAKAGSTDVVALAQSLKSTMDAAGIGVHEAYALLNSNAEVSDGGQLDWEAVAEKFRIYKVNSGAITERTWHKVYRAPVKLAVDAMQAKPRPTTGKALLEQLATGTPGSTGRRLRIQYVAQMLRFAVDQLGADRRWLPPAQLRDLIGTKGKARGQTVYLTDEQIVRLLEGITRDDWRLAVSLVACFGLRPVELHTLSAGPNGTLHVAWRKRTARRPEGTPERDVIGLDPVGAEGLSELVRVDVVDCGLDLLPRGCRSPQAGDALHQYLERLPVWQELKKETPGAVPYSLRHAYAARATTVGWSDRVAAVQMGHSLQTHHQHYSAVGADLIAIAHEQAAAAVAKRQAVGDASPA